MSRTPVLSQRLALEVHLWGSTAVTLDTRTLRSLRCTNTLTTGSAKLELYALYDPADRSAWPYGLRAMDSVFVTGWAGRGPDGGQRYPLWSGFLDSVEVTEDPQQGRRVHLVASTAYKAFEVTTETAAQYQQRVNWQAMPPAQVIEQAVLACGIAQDRVIVEDGPDLHSSPLAAVGTLNPLSLPGANPQYLSWAQIVASVATFAGRELFADEQGNIRYRLSAYDQNPAGTIPVERLVSAGVTLDTDEGLVNEVYVYYGTPQGVGQQALAAHAGPVAGDDQAHYRRRALILPAPWLSQASDAQWYADWVLSWATHNRRPGLVSLAFWPAVRLGQVYALPWPPGQRMLYYVSSVVHDVQVGGASTTVLGLTYGRQPEVTWFSEPAPANFGQAATTALPASETTGAVPDGARWRVTYYTPAGLASYDDTSGLGSYLLTSDSTKLYQSGWQQRGASSPRPYGAVRPCAFDPHYRIPELGGATLSPGDQLFVRSLGVTLECHDTIGTDVAQGAQTGRQLDTFFWSTPSPVPADYSDVRYVAVANANLDIRPPSNAEPAGVSLSPLLAPAAPGTPSATRAALAAATIAPQLGLDGNGRHTVAPTGSDLQGFLQTVIGPESGISNVQCTVFVLFVLIRYGGFPGIQTGPRTLRPWPNGAGFGGYLEGLGWQFVYGQLPRPGDVVSWSPGQTSAAGIVQDLSQGAGHVAIVTAVTPPAGGKDGTVQVAQANCPQALQDFTLYQTASGLFIGGPSDGSFFGATVAGLVRYPKAS